MPPTLVLVLVVMAMFMTLPILSQLRAGARRETFGWVSNSMGTASGEVRLREALKRVIMTGKDAMDAEDAEVWSELFEQTRGGQLFVQGKGMSTHSESDVIVNGDNPYSKYFLEYDFWSKKLQALAFPPVASLDDATDGVFCGSYASQDREERVFSVCDDVAASHKVAAVRNLWRVLHTIVLMRALDERENLTGMSATVSDNVRHEASEHVKRMEKVASDTDAAMERIVATLDSAMKSLKQRHERSMRKLRSKERLLTRTIATRKSDLEALRRQIDQLSSKSSDAGKELAGVGSKLQKLNLRIASEQRLLDQDTTMLANLNESISGMERSWRAQMDEISDMRKRAIMQADEAARKESDVQSRIRDAERQLQNAQRAIEQELKGGPVDEKRLAQLRSDADQAQKTAEALQAELGRIVSSNDAANVRIQQEMLALGQARADSDSALIQRSEDSTELQRTQMKADKAGENQDRAKLEASVRVGKVVNAIDADTVEAQAKKVYQLRSETLARQQAYLDAQYALLDGGAPAPAPAPKPAPKPKPVDTSRFQRAFLEFGKGSRVLDCMHGWCKAGHALNIYDKHGGQNQRFTYNPSTKRMEAQGACLEVMGDKSSVQMWNCHNNSNQKWTFQESQSPGDGAVQLVNDWTGKCLDVVGGKDLNGGKVGIWDCKKQAHAWDMQNQPRYDIKPGHYFKWANELGKVDFDSKRSRDDAVNICRDRCSDDDNCYAFKLYDPNRGNHRCYLYHEAGRPFSGGNDRDTLGIKKK